MQKRFSASTAILIVLLLSVLYAVGRVVNPPTKAEHDHDEAAAKEAQAAKGQLPDPKARGKMSAQQEEMMKRKMMTARADDKPVMEAKAGTKPAIKPTAKTTAASMHAAAPDGMDPSLWQEHEMGAVTIKPDAKK